jgi:hypothetical protein
VIGLLRSFNMADVAAEPAPSSEKIDSNKDFKAEENIKETSDSASEKEDNSRSKYKYKKSNGKTKLH